MSEVSPRSRRTGTGARTLVQGKPVDSHPVLSPEARRGSVLRITEVGEEILHRPCRPVTQFGTPELSKLIDDMFLTMYVAEGAGLAANQVDVDLQLFVYDCQDEDGVRHVGHILNPVIDEEARARRRLIEDVEGCLSVPGAAMEVPRNHRTVVRGCDQHGSPLVIEGSGYFARCLQHESDHLQGHLYLDRLARRDRRDALRQMADEREDVHRRRALRAAELTQRS
ncbi:peptide deformylase [Kitasatospora sp. HPMI-4]|uniref:peptide deformylase n=1 Tax=Kitasatospora sp. HPMI-4 TaxID=3448443 RepID=UPI003F19E036